jgi:hypothetical protein
MRIALFIVLSVISSAVWAGPYDGRYTPDTPEGELWDCKSVGKDGGAVLLTTNIFFALGTRCTLRDPVHLSGMDATLYNAICRSDGAPWERRIMIMRTAAGITVVQKGGHISPLRKCE